MKFLRHLACVVALLAGIHASAQVLVYTGTLKASQFGQGNGGKGNTSFVAILDISPERDPANFFTVLPINKADRVIECRDFSSITRSLQARGAKSKSFAGLIADGFTVADPADSETEYLLLFGPVVNISMGKGQTPLVYAKALSGSLMSLATTPPTADWVQVGKLSLRLQVKETKVANLADSGGATPGFVATVNRQREILVQKFKFDADSGCN
jgi:hypothetical protein